MFKYEVKNNHATITGIDNPNISHITIPQFLSGYIVSNIGKNAFKNNCYIETVSLPDSMGYIFEEAFCDCLNLKTVSFYKTNAIRRYPTLFSGVFKNCVSLESVLFEEFGELHIGIGNTRCFENCHKLKTIEAAFNWNISGYTFHNCYELDNLTFKQTILNGITFASTSLNGCKKLKNVTFLGNIASYTPPTIINKLKKMKVKCPANVNVIKLCTSGTNIQIIPRIPLPTDKFDNWVIDSDIQELINP